MIADPNVFGKTCDFPNEKGKHQGGSIWDLDEAQAQAPVEPSVYEIEYISSFS